jgi:hypothetical protein
MKTVAVFSSKLHLADEKLHGFHHSEGDHHHEGSQEELGIFFPIKKHLC